MRTVRLNQKSKVVADTKDTKTLQTAKLGDNSLCPKVASLFFDVELGLLVVEAFILSYILPISINVLKKEVLYSICQLVVTLNRALTQN